MIKQNYNESLLFQTSLCFASAVHSDIYKNTLQAEM